ncbi:SGNH/GDSL hydrolase family protein [Streptomyces sp. NPDC059568]|uniref:SGNH/GDSL hydrolase family protein n=1 Tax=Streptomyces sp. NPDC059568 TaxID=3346868 RepID=UPI0036874E8C
MRPRQRSPHGLRAAGVAAALLALLCTPLTAEAAPTAPTSQTQAQAPARTQAQAPRHQVVTWGASADRQGEAPRDRSYRMVVRTSVGGTDTRVRLSNAFGDQPVTFGSVHVGKRQEGAQVVRGTNRPLTFGGADSVTVSPGATVTSDPLPGRLAPGSDLAVSFHVRSAGGPSTGHGMAMQTSYATAGDHAAEEGADNWTDRTGSWYYLDAVSVETDTDTGAVVTLGDSITDGWQSSTDTNRRWPDYLARRLQSVTATGTGTGIKAIKAIKGVANEGISGNKVLADGAGQSALGRLQRDVLSQPGVRTVFLFEGINDIKAHTGVTAGDLIAGYREIIDRAHTAGICVVGATVLPYKGWYEYDAEGEAVRQDVNDFIRNSGELDAVADFDKALRSPYDQERLLPVFDGGDHIHPNDKGMQVMADTVDIRTLSCDR